VCVWCGVDGGSFDAGKVKKELKSLTKEMQISERQKKDIERKLDDLRNKTLKLQEVRSSLLVECLSSPYIIYSNFTMTKNVA